MYTKYHSKKDYSPGNSISVAITWDLALPDMTKNWFTSVKT